MGGSMSISTQKVVEDDFVPSSNQEMVAYYGEYVARLVMRYNRVNANFDDITQHVWMKLIETDVLGKYAKSGTTTTRKTMTAAEACEMLGISWGQWRSMMFYATPGAAESHPSHYARHYGKITPVPLEGGWCSKTAVFATEDVIRLHETGYFKKRSKWEVEPMTTTTRSKFKVYLSTSVHNVFANWCRTRFRKYKEMYLAPHEDGTAWEATLPDNSNPSTTSTEVRIAITQALGDVFANDPTRASAVLTMLNRGYTLVEIAKELKISSRVVDKIRATVLDNNSDLRETDGSATAWMMS